MRVFPARPASIPDDTSPLARRPRLVALLGAAALTTGVIAAVAPPAAATPGLAVTPASTVQAAPNSTTTLQGLAVSGDSTDSLQVTLATDVGTLTLPETGNLTLSYNNHWSGDQQITFTGLQSDVDAALSAAELVTGDTASQTANVSITAMIADTNVVYLASNGHFYQFFAAPSISWTDARAAALSKTFHGASGYLATAPNASVNDFITSKINGAINVWIGATSVDTPTGNPARTWQWADGPLANATISQCTNFTLTCNFVNRSSYFDNWASGEPNNSGGRAGAAYSGEWVAVTNWGTANGQWNDLAPSNTGAAGYVVEYGNLPTGTTGGFSGVVSASTAVLVVGAPDAPSDVMAERDDGSAHVFFTPPADNGGEITGYIVRTYQGAEQIGSRSCTSSPCAVDNLSDGTAYTFTVQATNEYGTGPESEPSSPVTPARAPDAPIIGAAEAHDGSAQVSFTAPDFDGGSAITGYTVTASPDGKTGTCTTSPCTVEGLTNGTSYTFTVRATNAVDDSVESDASNAVTPVTTPDAPGNVSAAGGDRSAVVSFDVPTSDGGTPIIDYVVYASVGGNEIGGEICSNSPCHFFGLDNGTTYTFTVAAYNSVGTGTFAGTGPVVPATIPDAPADLTVTRGDGQLTLNFDPANAEGNAITTYQVSLDGGDHWADMDTSGTGPLTSVVTGLENGIRLDVKVRAVNSIGAGAASSPSVPGTPAGLPAAPDGVTLTRGAGSGTLDVSWNAPNDNGDGITGYSVQIWQEEDGENVLVDTYPCDESPCTVEGLTNGETYTATVLATNTVGTGAASAPTDPATPATVPEMPAGLQVTSAAGSLTVSFYRPQNGGAEILGYQASLDGGQTWTPLTMSGNNWLYTIVTPLTNGTTYPVRVRAVNVVGAGDATETVSGKPATVPDASRSVTAHRAGSTAVVTWTAPASDGGSAITNYTVVAAPGGAQCTSTVSTCTFRGLPLGVEYTFTVTADNGDESLPDTGVGPSASSKPLLLTGKPDAPQAVSVRGGDRVLTVRFRAPADNGGTAITRYLVSIDGGRSWLRPVVKGSGPFTASIAGVRNGSTYRVAVVALNGNGAGPASVAITVTVPTWFHDPTSASARAKEIPVPEKPSRYHGGRRTTTAAGRAHDGTPAFPANRLAGRQLQGGEAASLGSDAVFAFDRAVLTAAGRSAVRRLATSLRYVTDITCEGYSDFGGRTRHQQSLSAQRARTVCAALRARGVHAHALIRAYGGRRPVVVGGTPRDRAANRRVIVDVRH